LQHGTARELGFQKIRHGNTPEDKYKKNKTKKASAQATHRLKQVWLWGRLCPLDELQPPLAAIHRVTIAGLGFTNASGVPSCALRASYRWQAGS
jgi:hypothetical protein